MKKIAALCLILLLAAVSFPTLAQADGLYEAGVVTVSSGGLNVRSGASTAGQVVATLSKGSYIALVKQSGSWWQVEYADGKYGYCHADYLRPVSASPKTVDTRWGSLNVRSGGGTGYAKTASLGKGTQVLELSSANGWSKILYHGTKTGWVSSEYLSAVSEEYPPVALALPNFKQTDSRWSAVKIGSSGKTIGQIGCATTAIAMMESYRTGSTVYPNAMSGQLSYDSSGNLYWPSYYTVYTDSNYLAAVYRLLSQGKPVLFGAKNTSGGQHWVVVTGYNGGGDLSASGFTVNDPGSSTRVNLQQLLNSYPNFYKMFHY